MKRMDEQEQIMLVDGKQHIIKYVDDYGHWEDLGALNDEGLLPCPFCGEYPEINETSAGFGVICYSCGIGTIENNWLKEYAITIFNRRGGK